FFFSDGYITLTCFKLFHTTYTSEMYYLTPHDSQHIQLAITSNYIIKLHPSLIHPRHQLPNLLRFLVVSH
uniref:Uncharacterized protein n=1 Tax=Triticum urartu TaxID=4572 RepID=A0A8R7NXI3_TRIUA